MTRSLAAVLLLAGALTGVGCGAEPAAGPSKDVPELEALQHYAGRWDSAMSIKPSADLPKGARTKGLTVGEWVLGGRYLRQTWEMSEAEGLPNLSGIIMMTYDPTRKAYRSWNFHSNGHTAEAQGVWDAKTRTLTLTSREADSGTTTVTRATFAADGTEDWAIVTRDRDGKVVSDVSGKNTRRKE